MPSPSPFSNDEEGLTVIFLFVLIGVSLWPKADLVMGLRGDSNRLEPLRAGRSRESK